MPTWVGGVTGDPSLAKCWTRHLALARSTPQLSCLKVIYIGREGWPKKPLSVANVQSILDTFFTARKEIGKASRKQSASVGETASGHC